MATGDLKNNLLKLKTEVKLMRYPESLDLKGLTQGDAKAFMPILHHAFTSYSTVLAEEIAAKDIVLFAKADAAFMDSIYRVLRDMFAYKPLVTKDQFFSTQFAERKIIMCTQILQHIQRRCRSHQPPKQSFKPNLSMDNLAKPPLGRSRPKSAVVEKKAAKNTSTTRPSTSMAPPRSGTSINRSASLRSSLPGPNKPRVVKEVLDPNMSCDSALPSSVPSIARVKPQSVEVITMQTMQGQARSNGSLMGFAESVNGAGGESELHKLISEHTKHMEEEKRLLESFERRIRSIETMFELRSTTLPAPTLPTEDQRYRTDLEARVKLLENRVLMLESNLESKLSATHTVDADKLKAPSPSKDSPVTPGKTGTFVTVESFVNGESKVRKMAREAEMKIRSRSVDDDAERLSPIVKKKIEAALNKSEEEMFTMIPDPEPGNSSTPAKAKPLEDSISLKCVDTPTQDQAHRIQHLMQSTQSMLMPAQTKIPAEEVSRQDVD